MTDPLSTIRQALEAKIPGEWHHTYRAALAACDVLEAERLTPEEARLALKGIHCRQKNGWTTNRELWAKLERIAGSKPTSIRAMLDGE